MNLERNDTLYGTVTFNRPKGCFIMTDSGNTVYMPKYNFPNGTRVCCGIFHTEPDRYPLVNLDSVIYDDIAA